MRMITLSLNIFTMVHFEVRPVFRIYVKLQTCSSMKLSIHCRFLTFREYLIPRFNRFPSNRENINSRMPNFYHSFLFITYVWKIKVRFQNCEMCFPRFYADINSSR